MGQANPWCNTTTGLEVRGRICSHNFVICLVQLPQTNTAQPHRQLHYSLKVTKAGPVTPRQYFICLHWMNDLVKIGKNKRFFKDLVFYTKNCMLLDIRVKVACHLPQRSAAVDAFSWSRRVICLYLETSQMLKLQYFFQVLVP